MNENPKQLIHGEKERDYYRTVNPEVVALLIPADSMLEIGCAEGLLGAYAREKHLFKNIYGLEFDAEAAEKAKPLYDKIYAVDIESQDVSSFPDVDVVICADVLEHLIDPWKVFSKLVSKQKGGGYMIVSIPNARHVRFWGPLVLRGRFDYEERGLMDKGHLRFFSLKNMQEWFGGEGLRIDAMTWRMAPKGRILNFLTFGLFKEFFAYQYIFRLRKI